MAAEAEREEANKREWKSFLDASVEALRNPGPGIVNDAQFYLYQRMCKGSAPLANRTEGDWRALIPEFGEPIALAFRDGAVGFWRSHRPQLRSEDAEANTIEFSNIFGLTGLAFEAREDSAWIMHLSETEAEIATRFALHELNGFPDWLPSLYVAHPRTVINVVMGEIDHELVTEQPESKSYYMLYNADWNGEWMWDGLAPLILARLENPPMSVGNLHYMLKIMRGSSPEDSDLARLATRKANATRNLETAPLWFATWVGVEPAVAIPALAARLVGIERDAGKTLFAMRFITALLGSRRESRIARQGYRTIEHMKALYLLMQEYVREKDDIERVGKGVYTPELRDDAQDARDTLFSLIREKPGKEAFLALMDISCTHPTVESQPWMAFYAKEKATLDADTLAWSPCQVREFHDQMERKPANHRDLWDLAVERLQDLKHDLEDGDASIASILQRVNQETEIRNYIGGWCRDRSANRYSIPQEEELADARRPDLRFYGVGFDGPVPLELKLADKWTGPHLFERLENQLCGDYLRDERSSRGIFCLVYQGSRTRWDLPDRSRAESFDGLIEALQNHWLMVLASRSPGVEDIKVIGIDLTKRGGGAKAASTRQRAQRNSSKAS